MKGMEDSRRHVSRRALLPDLDAPRNGFITNYPVYQHWKKTTLEEIARAKPINIYVHIPFCLQRCGYCYYKTTNLKGSERNRLIEHYVEALCREIDIAARHFRLHERTVASIYFGGGTPTLLKNGQLRRVVATIREHFQIDSPEFTVEAEPITLTPNKARTLKELGVNRISLGVQSFRGEILRLANRLDTEEKVATAVDIAKTTGAVINIDLLSGLAGETEESWAYSVRSALGTQVESISIYKMELYANTGYFQELRSKRLRLPSDAEEFEFMRYAIGELGHSRYLPWSVFSFSREGRYPNIYLLSQWRGDDCYSFGASAFGRLGDRLFQNTNSLRKYLEMLDSGELPINRGHSLSFLDAAIRTVILGIKLIRLDLQAFHGEFGFRLESVCKTAIDKLRKEDFVDLENNEICLTQKGVLYGDYVGKILAKSIMEKFA